MQQGLRYTVCMAANPGSERPGGRTARTRQTVFDAVRELLREPGAELTVPAVASRSGVHATTIYRRWRTIESLVLEVAVEDVTEQSPLPITGDLEADLSVYVRHLLASIQELGHAGFFEILLSATREAGTAREVPILIAPRLAEFQRMLDAAAVTAIDATRLVEIVLAPAYFWAQLGAPLDPDRDAARLVATAVLSANGPSSTGTNRGA